MGRQPQARISHLVGFLSCAGPKSSATVRSWKARKTQEGDVVSTDINALQLLPEIQSTTGLAPEGGSDERFIPTCWEPTCIITYCGNHLTVIG